MQVRAGNTETGDRQKLLIRSSDGSVTATVSDDGTQGAYAEVDLTANGGSSAAFARGSAALVAKLKSGLEPATVWCAGDSTANDVVDLFYSLFSGYVAPEFPAYTLTNLPWDDALQAFHPFMTSYTVPIRYGTAGDAYFTSATTKYLSCPDSAALSVTGDFSIRAKLSTVWNLASSQSIASKFGAAGQRSWRFWVNAKKLTFEYTGDGTTLRTFVATANVPFADGDTGYVRADLDVDNGAGGSTVTFYSGVETSTGVTWTQIGAPVTIATATNIFDSTAEVEIGARSSGAADPLAGNVYYVEAWNGALNPVIVLDLDDYNPAAPATITDRLGNVWTPQGSPAFGGAPGLLLVGCAVAGSQISYASDGTRFPKLSVGRTPDLCFIDYGHNDTATDYRTPYKTLTDAILAKWPSTNIVAVTQNPEEAPRTTTQINNQLSKMAQIAAFAAQQGFDLLDGLRAFQNANDNATNLDGSLGVHPSPEGYTLWERYGYDTLFKPYITNVS